MIKIENKVITFLRLNSFFSKKIRKNINEIITLAKLDLSPINKLMVTNIIIDRNPNLLFCLIRMKAAITKSNP
jgi:hypothetical protein